MLHGWSVAPVREFCVSLHARSWPEGPRCFAGDPGHEAAVQQVQQAELSGLSSQRGLIYLRQGTPKGE